MIAFIIRRLLILPLILLGVTVLIFSMILLLSPYQRLAAYISNPTAKFTNATLKLLIKKYGLDQPGYVQYFRWLGNVLHGKLGWSTSGKNPVAQVIAQRFPATAELVLYSIVPVVFGGIWLGVISAVHHNDPLDQSLRIFAIIGWSLPSFIFGLLILFIFYGVLGWLPPGRLSQQYYLQVINPKIFHQYTHLVTIDSILNWRWDIFWDALKHLIAPIISLSYISWAYLMRITRSSMLEALHKDYIRTARAKGVDERTVINKHAKRNALIPVATISGLMIIGMLGGVVITETIFIYPGIGSFAANAAVQLDYAGIMGIALLNSLILVLGNLFVDILYAIIDPRVRLD